MIPVCSALPDGKLISEGHAGLDGGETHIGYAIHAWRDQDPVPVYGCGDIHPVLHVNAGHILLYEAENRSGNTAVYGHTFRAFARKVNRFMSYCELVFHNGGIVKNFQDEKNTN